METLKRPANPAGRRASADERRAAGRAAEPIPHRHQLGIADAWPENGTTSGTLMLAPLTVTEPLKYIGTVHEYGIAESVKVSEQVACAASVLPQVPVGGVICPPVLE
jgi:hypothetical protein